MQQKILDREEKKQREIDRQREIYQEANQRMDEHIKQERRLRILQEGNAHDLKLRELDLARD
jgi:hypothetical protein